MPERTVEITNRLGMHARPAMQFAKTAGRFGCDVRVKTDEEGLDAKSVMDMMTLGAGPGTVLTIEADGDDAEACLDALVELVEAEFYEDDQGNPVSPDADA